MITKIRFALGQFLFFDKKTCIKSLVYIKMQKIEEIIIFLVQSNIDKIMKSC